MQEIVQFEVGNMWKEIKDDMCQRIKDSTIDVETQAEFLRSCLLRLTEPRLEVDVKCLAERTPAQITACHAELLNDCKVSIYVTGEISEDEAQAIGRWEYCLLFLVRSSSVAVCQQGNVLSDR